MSIEVIADSPRKSTDLRSMLVPEFVVSCAQLTGKAGVDKGCDAAVVAADLRIVENIAAIKELLPRLKHGGFHHCSGSPPIQGASPGNLKHYGRSVLTQDRSL